MLNKIRKHERLFQIINTVLVIAILGFYFCRMFYYQKKLQVVYTDSSYAALSKVMIERNDYSKEDRLYENEDGTYYFAGQDVNNYVNFNGQLFRIISIDENGNIKAIANESVTISVLNSNESFENTSLYTWLVDDSAENGGIYLNSVISKNSTMLVDGSYNYSTIDSLEDIPTENIVSAKIGLLTIDEYVRAGGANSFLNNGETFWLGNTNSDGKYYFVDQEGALGNSVSELLMFNVRPVITLTYAMRALSGEGTLESPYILTESTIETISNANSGSYVLYKDILWRVSSINSDGNVVIITDEPLVNEDGDVVNYYYGDDSDFSTSYGVGRYINRESTGLVDENYLVENIWYNGEIDDNYSYLDTYNESYTSYIGLPTLADLYLNDGEYFLANKVAGSSELILSINENTLYSIFTYSEVNVKVMAVLKGELVVSEGVGSKENPFVLEVAVNE